MVKPTYQSITRLAPRKPVIVFVPSRKQSKITALDLLSFCGAENQPQRFVLLMFFLIWLLTSIFYSHVMTYHCILFPCDDLSLYFIPMWWLIIVFYSHVMTHHCILFPCDDLSLYFIPMWWLIIVFYSHVMTYHCILFPCDDLSLYFIPMWWLIIVFYSHVMTYHCILFPYDDLSLYLFLVSGDFYICKLSLLLYRWIFCPSALLYKGYDS